MYFKISCGIIKAILKTLSIAFVIKKLRSDPLDMKVILVFAFFMILVSIQYTLNRILNELRDIRKTIYINQNNSRRQED